tara:strand:+ start:114 stop:287 length:174 start_codon:yes stop_codon:yes gene_type:complete
MNSRISIELQGTAFVVSPNGETIRASITRVTEKGETRTVIRPMKEQECSSPKGASHE